MTPHIGIGLAIRRSEGQSVGPENRTCPVFSALVALILTPPLQRASPMFSNLYVKAFAAISIGVLSMGFIFIAESAWAGEEADSAQWQITGELTSAVYLLREPVQFTVKYRNSSNVERMLRARGPLPLASGAEYIFRVGNEVDEEQIYMPSQYLRYAEAGMKFGSIEVNAGETVHREEWLVVGRPGAWELVEDEHVVSRGVTWMFPEPGRWTVALGGLPETVATFEVVEPEGDELAASRLFDGVAASAFVGGGVGEEGREVLTTMRRMLREYPESAYAPFAAMILARHEFRTEGDRTLRPKPPALRELLSPIFEHHKDHPLHAEALYLMWEATRHSRKWDQGGRTLSIAVELLEQHPYSSWSEKVRGMYAESEDLPPRPKAPPAATQPVSDTVDRFEAAPNGGA